MKCTECKYHSYIGNTYFCDANPKRVTRIDFCEVELDLPCEKHNKREKSTYVNSKKI